MLLPMVSLMLLLVFAGGLWFLRTRKQLRGASQSFLARYAAAVAVAVAVGL